jgi:hypothetical protein
MQGISQSGPFNEATWLEILDAFASVYPSIGLETMLPTHWKNLQLKIIRRRARSDGAAHRLQETR